MSEKIYDLGSYIENPPSIFDILALQNNSQYPNLQSFLKTFRNQVLPLLGNISDALENARDQLADTQKMEKNKQILVELQDLEREYLWAQFIELEAQNRAIKDLTQKLVNEISVNNKKQEEIDSTLSSTGPQFQQKNETVQIEFKKFRAFNAELQQLFKDQNQILRKITQNETQLNNPKVKKTLDEISTIEKELEVLHTKEQEIRQELPQKQRGLESQRLLHQQKEKEFRPLKVKYDGLIAEQVKLEQMLTTDKSRLEEKQKELFEISKKMEEFLRVNKIDPKNRPVVIRTKNIIEDKIRSVKARMRPDTPHPSDAKTRLINNKNLVNSFHTLTGLLETFQSDQIQGEIHALSKDILIMRQQITQKFSNLMNNIGRKGGVQVRSLITSNGVLNFIENGKEKSIASLLAFLLAYYGGKTMQIKINPHNLTPAQMEDLEGIINAFQSKSDSKITISEA